jgi:hypothetical protein
MTGDIIEMVAKGNTSIGPVPIANTFHFIMDPGSGPPDLAGMCANARATLLSLMLAIMSDQYGGSELKATVVAGPSIGAQFIDPAWVGSPGGIAGSTSPVTSCIVVRRSDGLGGRTGKGRLFVSPIHTTVFDDSGLMVTPPAGLAALEAYMPVPLLDGTSQRYNPVTFHKTPPGVAFIMQGGHSERAGVQRNRRFRL